jgi:hypothetical protein
MIDVWLDTAYDMVAMLGIVMCIYIMQKVEFDPINRIDPQILQWLRRLAFTIVALTLCYSIYTHNWRISTISLVSAGVGNLIINALALYMRQPPSGRLKTHTQHRTWNPVRWVISLHERRFHSSKNDR